MAKHTNEAPSPEGTDNATAKATRTLSKAGHHRQAIQIADAAWAKIVAHVDANDLDLDKWLTKQMTKIAEGLA